jgi:four helix bundle protein
MDGETKNPIRSFRDLIVYQSTYLASIEVISKIVPKLPRNEQNDLADQLRRSAKAIPRLIAEGYSKKHQRKGFQKYLDDAMAESNEMIVSLSHARDLYSCYVDPTVCENLIDVYDKSSRQLYNLAVRWKDFKER